MSSLKEILKTPFWMVLWLYIMLILMICWIFERESYYTILQEPER